MRSRSAALELTLLAVLVMAALLISFTWISLRWQRSWLLEEVQRGLSLASNTLHSSLRDGMMQNRRDQISSAIERVSRDTHIKQIRIINHRGQIIFSTDSEGFGRQLDAGAPVCGICHTDPKNQATVRALAVGTRTSLEGGTMRAFTPILAEEGCIAGNCHAQDARSGVLGIIDLSLSLQAVEGTMARDQSRMALASLAAILLGGGLLWLALALRFRRPMNDVLRGIRRVASGGLNYRIPVRSHDEFGQLAESFNALSLELEAVQQSLIDSERLISMGQLAAGVVHEIDDPLSGILSSAESLLGNATSSDPRRKNYEVIVREALRCRQIIHNLLDFARQDELATVRSHPRVLIEKALDVVIPRAAFRNIRFVRDLEEDLPAIEVDTLEIVQVLVNLLVNAQQAMPQGGQILIGAHCSGDRSRVEFSVQDERVGMPAEMRTQIFSPFFSAKSGKSGGLGLWVCSGIVQRHGGTIDVQNEAGKGTTFRFVLPIQRKRQADSPQPQINAN